MGTVSGNVVENASPADRPEYATKVRDLRKVARLTQPKFASELRVKRGAVAQWEGGTREPRTRNYEALVAFAEREKLTPFAKFFRDQISGRPYARRERREQKMRGHYAIRYFRMIEGDAAMGDERARRLIKLAQLDRRNHADQILKSLRREIARLETWAVSDLLEKARDEAREVENLRSVYESSKRNRVGRRGDVPK
jgi:transcriptional regulator with XRE-family HTH domain